MKKRSIFSRKTFVFMLCLVMCLQPLAVYADELLPETINDDPTPVVELTEGEDVCSDTLEPDVITEDITADNETDDGIVEPDQNEPEADADAPQEDAQDEPEADEAVEPDTSYDEDGSDYDDGYEAGSDDAVYASSVRALAITGTTTIGVGQSYQLKALVIPHTQTVTWESANTAVAEVDANTGVVTGVKTGTAKITAMADTKKTYFYIKVTNEQNDGSVELDEDSVNVNVGETKLLNANVLPVSDTAKPVTWKTSSTSIVTVSNTGEITAKKAGEAYIIATSGTFSAGCYVTVNNIEATKVTLSETNPKLTNKQTLQLTATVVPENATNKQLVWTSSNKSVASVSSSGLVKALSPGTTTITAMIKGGSVYGTCLVTVVSDVVSVTSVKLNQKTGTVPIRWTLQLTANVFPANAGNKAVIWTSDNKNVATVSSSGLVKGIGAGKATITAASKENGISDTCVITVEPILITGISLSTNAENLVCGKSFTLKATITPSNATSKDLTWTSSNTSVATVTNSGSVKAINAGKAVITAAAKSGGAKASCTVTVTPIALVNIKPNKTSFTMTVGKTDTLKYSLRPSNASPGTITWKSSNPSVASISNKGIVKALKAGSTVITVTSSNGNKSGTCTLTVKNVTVKSVKLNKTKANVSTGKTVKLKATVNPTDATIKEVTWKSDKSSVATVDSKGVVTGKKAGTAVITATTKDGQKTAKCTVTVKDVKVKSVSLNKKSASVQKGKTITLKATVKPTNASNTDVTWKSSDTKIATVDKKGVVKGVKAGKATITVTTKDGNKTAKCKVTVKK